MVKDKTFLLNAKKRDKYSLKEKILKLLLENKREWTILEISKNLKVDYKNTFEAINNLSPELILKNKKGNTNLIEIKISPSLELYEIENKRTNEFLSNNPKVNLIQKDIERIDYPFFIVLLFGSVAKGISTPNSDIDICIITDNKEKSNELSNYLRLISLNLEIQEFTSKEFVSMIEKKRNNLGNEIIKNNILLYGVENYYNLISKWMKKE